MDKKPGFWEDIVGIGVVVLVTVGVVAAACYAHHIMYAPAPLSFAEKIQWDTHIVSEPSAAQQSIMMLTRNSDGEYLMVTEPRMYDFAIVPSDQNVDVVAHVDVPSADRPPVGAVTFEPASNGTSGEQCVIANGGVVYKVSRYSREDVAFVWYVKPLNSTVTNACSSGTIFAVAMK